MAGDFRRSHPQVVLALLAGLAAGALSAEPALAQQPSAADIQWAQTILKEKNYDIGGRPNGQLTPQTKSALSRYQKDHGLPATGNLDQGTVAKMMGENAAKPQATMGNLAQQKIGGGGPGQAPRTPPKEVVPRAAQRGGDVDNIGGGEVTLGPVVRGAPSEVPMPSSRSTAPSVAQGGTHADAPGVPQAAPRAAVTAATADGKEVPVTALSKDEDGFTPPGWLRYVVMGVLAGTLGFIGLGWWRSGRPSSAPPVRDEPREVRREPSFAARRDELTTGPLPRLSGERRGR
ncbi:peptidoglycan-binding domain-containing protein [Azospirillum sp. sgz301742]